MNAPMLLSTYLERYAREQGLEPSSLEQLSITVRLFRRFLKSDPTLTDLNDDAVNLWLDSRAKEVSPTTVRNNRRNLRLLWAAAYESRLIENRPERIRKVRVPHVAPRAWSLEQVQSLLKACRHAPPNLIGEIRHSLYWRLFISITWDTAFRRGDVLRLRLDQIGEDGLVVITQRKTGWDQVGQLCPATIEMIKETMPTYRSVVIPWPFARNLFERRFKRLVEIAGIPVGTSKWLRRSSATHIEASHPGAAMAHLGHKTPGVAYRNYIDPRLIAYTRPTPTPLSVPPDYTPTLVKFVPQPPTPQAPTHYGLEMIGPEVLEKLLSEEAFDGPEAAAMARHLGVTYKAIAAGIGANVKHLGQIFRGKLPITGKLESKLRQFLRNDLAAKGGAA